MGGEGYKKQAVVTDPYGPPVGTMPLDDTEFVVKVGEELPAESGGRSR